MELDLWLVCANSQVQPPPHTEIQLYPSMSFSLAPRKMCACVLGGTASDEHLGKGPAPLLACNLHCHLGGTFHWPPRTRNGAWGGSVSVACQNLVSDLESTLQGLRSALSWSGWAELHRRTLLSNHPLLFPRTICSGRHRRRGEAGRCYFLILQSIVWLIWHQSVIFLLVETSWLAIPKWNWSSTLRAVPWLTKPRCWSHDYLCPNNNAPQLI